MTPDQRHEIRAKIVADLESMVRAAGGDNSDACAILGVAFMVGHAAGGIVGGWSEHRALIDCRRFVVDNYSASYRSATRALLQATGRN